MREEIIHFLHPKQIDWEWCFVNPIEFLGKYVPTELQIPDKFQKEFQFKITIKDLHPAEVDRIIEMAWEDMTSFDAIDFQFDLKEKEVIKLMRSNLKTSSFKLWRKRVTGRKSKHGFPYPKKRCFFELSGILW